MTTDLGDRPATVTAAFAADSGALAPDSPTGIPSGSDPTPAAATGQPDQEGHPSTPPGPIPFERHKEILDGAYKERDTFKAELEALGWAKQIPREQLEAYAQRAQQFGADPYAWLSDFVTELQGHPQHGQSFRSWVARQFQSFRAPQAQTPDPEPDADIPVFDETGHEVNRTYSAPQLKKLREWERRQLDASLEEKYAPLKQQYDRLQQREQVAAVRQQANETASTLYAKAQAWPQFKEHEPAIAEAFAQHPEWTLQDAYMAIVLPQLQQTEQAKVLDTLEKKAAASAPSPNAAAVSTTHRPRSLMDPSLKWGA